MLKVESSSRWACSGWFNLQMQISYFSGARFPPPALRIISQSVLISRGIMHSLIRHFTMPLTSLTSRRFPNLINLINSILTNSTPYPLLEIHKLYWEKSRVKVNRRNNNPQRFRQMKMLTLKINKLRRKSNPKTTPSKTDSHTQSKRYKSIVKSFLKKHLKCQPNTRLDTMRNSLLLNN